jgi:hypothetical protein
MFSHYKKINTNFLYPLVLFLVIVVLLITTMNFLNYGLDTIWDEGFYMLWLDSDYKDQQVTQSYNIINFFGNYFKNDLLSFRIFSFFFKFILYSTLVVYSKKVFELYSFKTKISDILVLAILFSFSFLINNKVITYRELEQSFVLFSWLFSLHFLKSTGKSQYLLLFLIAFSSTLALLVIPPPGLLNALLISIYLFINRLKFKHLIYLVVFAILSIVFYSLTVSNLFVNYDKILNSGISSGKSDNRYSIIGILSTYLPLIKSFITKYAILAIITFYLSKFVRNKFFTTFIYLFYTIYCFYQFDYSTDFIGFLSLALIISIPSNPTISKKQILNCIILLSIPIASIIGSAMPPSINLYYFLPIWGGLILYIQTRSKIIKPLFVLFIVLFSIISISKLDQLFKENLGNKKTSPYFLEFADTRIKGIGITQKQKKYFLKTKEILTKTKFDSKKDLFFTFNYDLMTVYVFKGKLNSEPFHRLSMYVLHYQKGHRFKTPKYLFLDEISAKIVGKNNQWDFPKHYDRYSIGCPDISNTERFLFCRKQN